MQRNLQILLMLVLIFAHSASDAQSILQQNIIIPMQDAGPQGLETVLVWPNLPGKHPLALISHGTVRNAEARREMTPSQFLPIAIELARRGFAVAIVMRRGHGNSGGNWGESEGPCDKTDYMRAVLTASVDLHTAIDYLGTLAQFDINHMVAIGMSAGGIATVALTANNPPSGLVAAISFAGGLGSNANDTVCQQNALVSTFGMLGKTSRVPMLWIYAANDHFFIPSLAQKFVDAFKASGGNLTFILAPTFQSEGHFLFSTEGMPIWMPWVDDFLKNKNLDLLPTLLPPPDKANLSPPSQLAKRDQSVFDSYLKSPPHKAFAISPNGTFGWWVGMRTIEEAQQKALEACATYTTQQCTLYAVDDDYAN